MDPETSFYLVRHGTTEYNDPDAGRPGEQLRGFKDVPLEAKGQQEAEEIGKKLPPLKHIFTSPLKRAQQTAQIIQKHTGGEIHVDEHMLPWHIGDFSGRDVADVGGLLEDYNKNPQDTPPNGEPFGNFYSRWFTGVQKLAALGHEFPGQVAAVVHGRNMDHLDNILKQRDPAKHISYTSSPGDIVHVQLHSGRGWNTRKLK